MCKHTYLWHNKEKNCEIQSLISLTLPLDDKGLCIFHSNNLEWKYENDCFNYFVELLGESNEKNEPLNIHNFKVVGLKPEQHGETAMFEGNAICRTTAVVKNDLAIFDSVFYDDVYLENVRFLGNVSLATCEFRGDFEIKKGSKFMEDLEIIDKCVFHSLFSIDTDTLLDGPVQIENNTYRDIFYMDALTCHSPVYIVANHFLKKDGVIDFTKVNFKHGMSFQDNHYEGLLNFFECVFYDENSLGPLPYDADFSLADCDFYGSMLFQGNKGKLLFGPNSILKIGMDQFHGAARWSFNYCDILNLNDEFIEQAKKLEELHLIKINENCRTQRFIHKFVFPFRDINEDVYEDYMKVIGRYFASIYTTRLNISYRRLTERPALEVVYSSDEDLKDSFDEKLKETLEAIKFGSDKVDQDLALQLHSVMWRLKVKEGNNDLEPNQTENLLSLMTTFPITINNVMGNNYNISQFNTGNHVNQQLDVGGIESQEKIDLKTLVLAVKEEVTSQAEFTPEQLTQTAAFIDEMYELYVKGEKIDPSWRERLLGVTGNLASIGSLLQGFGI